MYKYVYKPLIINLFIKNLNIIVIKMKKASLTNKFKHVYNCYYLMGINIKI